MRYELTEKNLTISMVREGKGDKMPSKPVKPAANYVIHLECRPDVLRVRINGEDLEELKGEFRSCKFGFLGNKEVRIQNFRLEGEN